MEKKFDLADDDYEAIQIAKNVARRLLKDPRLTPEQVIDLGHALQALDRLPVPSPGLNTAFGIVYRHGTEEFREMRFVEFRVSESAFEIAKGGSVYEQGAGSDTISEPGWLVQIDGSGTTCDLYDLEEMIEEYLSLGAEIIITA